jgi:phosphoribosyl 1,2-cyclic phosphodiesterase
VKVKVWGARGSVPAPGPQMNRYGGNTSCVQVTLDDGTQIILDAGTGIRTLGLGLTGSRRINLLLTHLHLDHIQGLMFFPPCFRSDAEITIWGPASPEASLEDRIARYISAPLSPVEIRELPCSVSFLDTPATEWQLGNATICAAPVTHRGPTLGYRITDGPVSLCYIPDHEPALGAPLAGLEPEWISGFDLACRADLLVHDCQYTDGEYPGHVGWGHSAVGDTLTFAHRVEAKRVLMFHHDPLHADEFLDNLHKTAREGWTALGHDPELVTMAAEGAELTVEASPPPAERVEAPARALYAAGTKASSELSTPG